MKKKKRTESDSMEMYEYKKKDLQRRILFIVYERKNLKPSSGRRIFK